jgi:predicted metalloprotease with PDZ domain
VADPEVEWSGGASLRPQLAEWTRSRGKSPRLYPGALAAATCSRFLAQAELDGTSAAAAGLRAGDLILAVDGEPTPSVDAVHKILGRQTIVRTLTLRGLREGRLMDKQATVAGWPEDKTPPR